jgi:Fe-S cluster biogenesis protein NfuA
MECFQRGIYKRKEVGAMREKVETALEQIRPMLQQDGGDVELVDVDGNGLVKVRLKGACSG